MFGNLGDGTPPAGETVIEVWAQAKCTCDDCGCYDDEASMIRLELDTEPIGEPCASSQCEFVVVLTPGIHAITAIATYDSGETSSSIQVEVPGQDDTTGTGTTSGAAVDEPREGCGCTEGRRSNALALLFVVGALTVRRRRR